MRYIFFLLILCAGFSARSQGISGIIADSISGEVLPFATIEVLTPRPYSVISGINGEFHLQIKPPILVRFSHIGYLSKLMASSSIKSNDTIFLLPVQRTMETVIIKSNADKIARIIEQVVQNRDRNNPEKFNQYECNIYYKMTLDMGIMENIDRDSLLSAFDSLNRSRKQKKKKLYIPDTIPRQTPVPMHMMMIETYTKRLFRKPETQEIVLASRLSGLDKTYFPNIVTEVLPFHLYTNLISLNGKEYANPIARGWQERYRIILEDEIIMETDTIFLLSFSPRQNMHFNSLKGFVYINSKGYAISHMAASSIEDPNRDRFVKFEHIYTFINEKWFPLELNYDIVFKRVGMPFFKLEWNGRSKIDQVKFENIALDKFDKTHPVKLHDSVDLRTENEWNIYRKDTMTTKERNTYKIIDSLVQHTPVNNLLMMMARLPSGLISFGKLDVDLKRIASLNQYEKYRIGIGLYTNTGISKYFSTGGWAGYGFRDKRWKYGYDLHIFPKANRDQSISFSFANDYRIPGQFEIHPELSRKGLRNWLFRQVDRIKEYSLSGNFRAGYWQFNPAASITETRPMHYAFEQNGKLHVYFNSRKYSIGFRYVYNEKRYPFFDYYLPSGTPKYPVFYFRMGKTFISSDNYKASTVNLNAAITWQIKNRWGRDRFYTEAGLLLTDKIIPKSFLFGGNGTRRTGINYYSFGGFITMKPFDYYTDKYLSFIYAHDFYKYFWNTKWSKPYLSLSHNMIYGSLRHENKIANKIPNSFDKGYHESGVMLNQLLRKDLRIADFNINAGLFYHWTNKWERKNAIWVIGSVMSF